MIEKIKELNVDISTEDLRKITYNIFCILIFLLPVVPELGNFGLITLKITLFNLITIITTIVLILLNIKEIKKFKFTFYDGLNITYLLLVILSSIFSKFSFKDCFLGTNGRGEGILTIFSYLMTFTIIYKGFKYFNKKLLLVGIIGSLVLSLYGIIQANAPAGVKLIINTANVPGVAEGTMGNQNFFSSYLCIFLPMMCYYFLETKDYKSIIAVVLLFTAFVFAKTLGGYIVFAVMYVIIAVFCFVFSKKKTHTIIKFGAMTILLVAIFFSITYEKGDKYVEEVKEVKKEATNLVKKDEGFGTGRMGIWHLTLMAINNNKLLGVGPDSLAEEFRADTYKQNGYTNMLDKYRVDKAHCELLQIAATTGIPSMIVYLMLIATIGIRLLIIVFRKHIKDRENKDNVFETMVLVSIGSYVAQALGNISVAQVAPIFWLMLGIAAAITLKKDNEKTEK